MSKGKSNVKLNGEAVKKYLASRGMSQPRFAAELNINYSHLYRLVKGERGMGIKLFLSLQRYCEKRGLNCEEFIIEEDGCVDKR